MRIQTVANVDALIEGAGLAVEIDGREIVLFRSGDEIFALDNMCPHAGSRLERGRVIGRHVICPLHGAKFSLADGSCGNPKIGGERPIVTHRVNVVEGRINVALSDYPTTPPQS